MAVLNELTSVCSAGKNVLKVKALLDALHIYPILKVGKCAARFAKS